MTLSRRELLAGLIGGAGIAAFSPLELIARDVPEQKETLADRLKEGRRFFEMAKYQEALDIYTSAEQVYGRTPELTYRKVECYCDLEKIGDAEREVECMESDHEKSTFVNLSRARILSKKKEYEKALSLLSEARTSEEWATRGFLLTKLNKLDDAKSAYESSLMLDANNSQVLSNLGSLYLRLKDHTLAERYLRNALEIEPKNVIALHGMGYLSAFTGHIEEAEAYFKRTLEVNPDFEPAKRALSVFIKPAR